MLVVFSSKNHENIVMFEEVASALIKLMGHSGTIPSALSACEIPSALLQLKKKLGRTKAENQEELDEEPAVSLAHRAFPLIAMLEKAEQAESYVMWKFM